MTVFERIQLLAQKQGKSVKDVSRDLGFGESTIYKWKTQSPKAEYLDKIADYFHVSIDYLMGRTEIPDFNPVDHEENQVAKQIMMRMDTDGLTSDEIASVESEVERFLKWRLEEIMREKEKN